MSFGFKFIIVSFIRNMWMPSCFAVSLCFVVLLSVSRLPILLSIRSILILESPTPSNPLYGRVNKSLCTPTSPTRTSHTL